MNISYKSIGTIMTPFTEKSGMPIQTVAARDVEGIIRVEEEFREGLKDIEHFSHLLLLYDFHLMTEASLVVRPFLDNETHGVFATRHPMRPNKIGISIVRLKSVQDLTLTILDVDMLNGTPLLDIKPYVPAFDHREADRIGWYETKIKEVQQVKSSYDK